MRFAALLLAGLVVVGCGRGQKPVDAVVLPPDVEIENVVGDLMATQPRVTEMIGEWKSVEVTPLDKSDMATMNPFTGRGRWDQRESWRYRIVGKKSVAVVDAKLERLNEEPWRWTFTDPVTEQEFLARYEARPRSPEAVRLDEQAKALILADPLVKAACGEVKDLVVLERQALKANDRAIDYFQLPKSGRPKGFVGSAFRSYEASGPDGVIQLIVRFEARGDSGDWEPRENAVQPVEKGSALWIYTAYPPPQRISLLAAAP